MKICQGKMFSFGEMTIFKELHLKLAYIRITLEEHKNMNFQSHPEILIQLVWVMFQDSALLRSS